MERDRNYLSLFENDAPPEKTKEETPAERKEREWKEKMISHVKEIKRHMIAWNPKNNPNATKDPYKTLVVSRLSKDTNEKHLKRVFEEYGPVKKVVIIRNIKNDKPRHYAFIEYEDVKDFKGWF